ALASDLTVGVATVGLGTRRAEARQALGRRGVVVGVGGGGGREGGRGGGGKGGGAGQARGLASRARGSQKPPGWAATSPRVNPHTKPALPRCEECMQSL